MPNPIWNNRGFTERTEKEGQKTMSLQRVISKAWLCFALLVISTAFMWARHFAGQGNLYITVIALAGGLGSSYVSYSLPHISFISLPIHAILEGLAVGGISALLEVLYPGVPLNVVLVTFCAAMLILAAYRFTLVLKLNRILKVIFLAFASIGMFYVLTFLFRLFAISVFTFKSPLGIGICIIFAALGSWNLVNDMEFIERSVEGQASKRYEWTAVLGLMVTMGWVYLEFFRLLNFVKRTISGEFSRHKDKLSNRVKGKKEEQIPEPEEIEEPPEEKPEEKEDYFPYG